MSKVFADSCLLRIEASGKPLGSVLECVGEIDLASIDSFRRALEVAVRSGAPEVVVDLREVSFLDSSGMGELLRTHHRLSGERRRLRVRARPRTARLLGTVTMDRAFTIDAD